MAWSALTKNDTIALMHENTAFTLREIAAYCKKHELTKIQIIKMLYGIADLHESQSIVVNLRDELTTKTK